MLAVFGSACSSHPPERTATPSLIDQESSCEVNPQSAPVPPADPYRWVPEADRVSVTTSGIESGTLTPGATLLEVDVTVCNDSPVDYPRAGVVMVFDHCSCAPGPLAIPAATIERFDAATNAWVALPHPAAGTGMDYLGTFTDVQPLLKGASFTIRYRVGLDASMTNGTGGLSTTVVDPDGPTQIGGADTPFRVTGSSTGPCAAEQVQIGSGGEQAAAGHRSVTLTFTLAPGSAECTLAGYPGVDSGAGGPLLHAKRTPTGYMGGVPTDPPPPVTLTPTQSAAAIVEGAGSDPQGNACPTYTDLVVTAPNASDPVTVPTRIDTCALEVHPVSAA